VRGVDRLPEEGPFLVVGNHSGGQWAPDLPILFTKWWDERGVEEPVYSLFHSFFLGLPGIGSLMSRAGGIEAGQGNAEAVLDDGGIVVVFPGGDHEVFRPWSERNQIEFNGRSGFVRLALRTGVPIVPCVSVGAHESIIVLTRGERIARLLGFNRFRVKVYPLVVAPPFGVMPGAAPALPLPSKVTVELGPMIDWRAEHGPDAADDDALVGRLYDHVVDQMQATLDRLAAERHLPILG